MNISLDYDSTYTRDPEMWNIFIANAHLSGHKVYCVTMRHTWEGDDVREALEGQVDYIFFTGRKAKKKFMYDKMIGIDVWIDDIPFFILNDASS